MLNLSILTEVADLRAVVDGLEVTGVADSGNLFILGRSMSGVVSSIFAARQPNDFAGLILYYPAFNMPGTSDKYKDIDEIPEKSLAMDNRRVVGKAFYVDMFGMDPFEAVHAYDGDVLIVHGDQVRPCRLSGPSAPSRNTHTPSLSKFPALATVSRASIKRSPSLPSRTTSGSTSTHRSST